MKIYLSTAIELKSEYPNYKDWETAMINKYGSGITSKTNEIWNRILDKERKIINDPNFIKDAKEFRSHFDDYYKWQSALIKKYGGSVQNYLYSVWIETKNSLIEEDKKEIINNSIEELELNDAEWTEFKSIFWLKIACIILLFVSLLQLPIGYYTFLRIIVCGTSAFSAFSYYVDNKRGWAWLFGIMAIVFNPIIPLYLGKSTWSVIDIFTAIIFLISIFILKEFPKKIF